jgi:tetratricopeptide (TPR) repeat protein
LLLADAGAAEVQARKILKAAPGQPDTLFLLAIALNRQAKHAEALAILEMPVLKLSGRMAVELETASVLAALGRYDDAIALLRLIVQHEPGPAWRMLGDLYALTGKAAAADEAYLRHIQASVRNPLLVEAAQALGGNRLPDAERVLRSFIKTYPTDVAAIRMLADVAARGGRLEEAESLLERTLELCPSFAAARANYAGVLNRQQKSDAALAQVDILRRRDPRHPGYRILEAAVLVRLGELNRAIAAYRTLLHDAPNQPKVWTSLGHALKTAGRQKEAIEAYRECLKLEPGLGEAWWSLANLKTFRFSAEEIVGMRTLLSRSGLTQEDHLQLHFALGKALEDRGDYQDAFRQYEEANAQCRAAHPYHAAEVTRHKQTLKTVLTEEFFAVRAGGGCQAADPIFIVGLPRSGSTLVEQILASHSLVEGTEELPDIFALVGRLRERDERPFYPQIVPGLTAQQRIALGEAYLARTRKYRRLGRPFFIDKLPNNFLQIGFIELILPQAKIIDVRRHPMACGFSCFKQYFARGQEFSYSLADIGRYYADYVELMAHYDAVLPGRVHRLQYEALVDDLEGSVRRLLDYCGLPFEENCLRFYQNDRIVRTASSEQVRQPVYADAVEHWRHFEPWLGPLKEAL